MANTTAAVHRIALPQGGFPWSPYIVPIIISYSLLCSQLRFQRRDAMQKKYNFPDRRSLSQMTNVQAQEILQYLTELEFPQTSYTSVQFALFKTYGIPTISNLLAATRQLSSPENVSKRYADTGVLIQEFSAHHPKSDRVIRALARVNYIHSRYQKSGKISQNDLLYTLSVFITEPVVWTRKCEWRSMTDMEICAIGTFWKSIGDAMGIEYEGRLSKSEWIDGLEFYEDIKAWAENYEEKYMIPAMSNMITADQLVPLLLFYVPRFLKGAARNMVGVLMGNRLREAMMYPTPPKPYLAIASALFGIRRFVLRYLSLPRPSFMRVRELGDKPDPKTGRYQTSAYYTSYIFFRIALNAVLQLCDMIHYNEPYRFSGNTNSMTAKYFAHPYYNKPSFLNRWGPEAWFVWASGGDVPGSKGDLYIPQGYVFEEVGPEYMKNKGLEEMKAGEEKLRAERPAGCPEMKYHGILDKRLHFRLIPRVLIVSM